MQDRRIEEEILGRTKEIFALGIGHFLKPR